MSSVPMNKSRRKLGMTGKVKSRKYDTNKLGRKKLLIPNKRIEKTQYVVTAYKKCKSIVIASGFGSEISWQQSTNLENLTESDFLREHAWVTLASGMNERVIRKVFPKISECFFNWGSAQKIVENESKCRHQALNSFGNTNKINAIISASHIVYSKGFGQIKSSIVDDLLQTIREFPFMGPKTSYHLAKNIGLQVAKPDRHLTRLAEEAGYEDVQSFCSDISSHTGDTIPVVDIVLWRFATLNKDYLRQFIEFGGINGKIFKYASIHFDKK